MHVVEQRPTAGGGAGLAFSGSLCGSRFAAKIAPRIHQHAELVEAVGGGEAGGGELPERVGGLWPGEAGDALQVVGEAGSALLQESAQAKSVGAERSGQQLIRRRIAGASAWGSQSADSRM